MRAFHVYPICFSNCNRPRRSESPDHLLNTIKQNQSIKAHSLLLVDIGLDIKTAKNQIKKAITSQNLNLPDKIILISQAGTENQKIIYNSLEKLPSQINRPYAFIIPSELSFTEKEFLEKL